MSAATCSRSTSGASFTFFICTCRICTRPRLSGRSTSTWRSKRPARSSAGSRISGRLVAASSTSPSRGSKPSISTSSWLSVCSFSSCPPTPPLPRARPSASSSSMKMIAGRLRARLLEQVAHARRADADEHLDELRAADRKRTARLASPATARASSVLPVPGGPTAARPSACARRGGRSACGSFRNPTISSSSSLASSTPATSANVVLCRSRRRSSPCSCRST